MLVCQRAGFKNVKDLAHISTGKLNDGIGGIFIKLELFKQCNFVESGLSNHVSQGTEAEASATRLQSRDNLGHIVADHAEASGLGVLLNDYTELILPCSYFF